MRSLVLSLLLSSVILSSCQNVKDNNKDRCGNGIIEIGEECDKILPTGITCPRINPNFPKGEVSCSSDCRFDLTHCTIAECGDGLRNVGESCDGTDLAGEICETVGIFNSGELKCDENCNLDVSQCTFECNVEENFTTCDPFGGMNECCPKNGKMSYCSASYIDGTARCLQSCDVGDDCGWSLRCITKEKQCNYYYCGDGVPDTRINDVCSLNGERQGWCYPLGNAMDNLGICIQNGTASHGSSCEIYDDLFGKTDIDASGQCDAGLCTGSMFQGTCLAFCDPESVYNSGIDTCPDNYNCLNLSDLDFETSTGNDPNPYFLFRTAQIGVCYPQIDDINSVISDGILTCDLLTENQIKDQAHSPCPDSGGCKRNFMGSLMGNCMPIDGTGLSVGDTCEITDFNAPRPCKNGLECFPQDPFNDPSPSNPTWACDKYCNADWGYDNNPGCTGLTTIDGTPFVCLTVSRFFTINHELPVSTGDATIIETSPSPMGFCVPPPGN